MDKSYQSNVDHVYPLNDCLNRTSQFSYNSERGLENYYDPFAQLFCVQINNAPPIGEYYSENRDIDQNVKGQF
jgi:hypothetical protein